MKTKILIVEDQFIEANNLRIILKNKGYQVTGIAATVPEALKLIDESAPDIVMLDIYLDGDLTGIDLAGMLRKKNIAFIFLSANSDKKTLDAAKVTKPYGFLVKPFRQKDVLVMLDVALYLHRETTSLNTIANSSVAPKKNPDDIQLIGKSAAMEELTKSIQIAGPSGISVLILGESGTGKELIAKSIHRASGRKDRPLVVVNCGALPANLIESELFGHEKGAFTGAIEKRIGKFEEADGGTIFLDEIGELPMDLQVRFLRVLQEQQIESVGGKMKTIDVRVIAATNKNLEEEITLGKFRLDLYYRLNVFPIHVPSLADRKEDIPLLATHFINLYAARENKFVTGFSQDVISSLLNYSWPGNIRELENLMARTALLSDGGMVSAITLPTGKNTVTPTNSAAPLQSLVDHERQHILAVLEKCSWKIFGTGGAAEILQMNESTLRSKMKKLGIEKSR